MLESNTKSEKPYLCLLVLSEVSMKGSQQKGLHSLSILRLDVALSQPLIAALVLDIGIGRGSYRHSPHSTATFTSTSSKSFGPPPTLHSVHHIRKPAMPLYARTEKRLKRKEREDELGITAVKDAMKENGELGDSDSDEDEEDDEEDEEDGGISGESSDEDNDVDDDDDEEDEEEVEEDEEEEEEDGVADETASEAGTDSQLLLKWMGAYTHPQHSLYQ
jgi:hypothetical protein